VTGEDGSGEGGSGESRLPAHVRVAIVGAGFGGLGAAIRLLQSGERDFVVLEKADDIGGTWRDNSYPGCACDVPSVLYSYSFAPNPAWTYSFSRQAEIWAYLRDCVERFRLTPYLRLGVELVEGRWDDESRLWRIRTSAGELTADVLVAATGPLCEPRIPDLPGLSSFAGNVFHSARWRHDLDLTGRDVAVVGTGASAIQFVPQIAETVRRLTIFQRTAPWIVPRSDRRLSRLEHAAYRRFPVLQRISRSGVYAGREALVLGMLHPRIARLQQKIAERHLQRVVADPALRAAMTPDYAMGCKRILISSDYLPAVQRDNVRLETTAVERVLPGAVVGADGVEHPVDTIILGTGFHVTDQPIADRLVGRDGRTLAEHWAGSPQAYGTVTVHGFPNLFLILGPNSGTGHTSVVLMAEAQIEHLLAALRHLQSTGAVALEPTAAAQTAFVREVDRRMRGSVWTAGGCRSWYLDRTGRNSALWPGFTLPLRRRLRTVRAADYELTAPAPVEEAVA
jgi:cation diffusion facilitator CzcD-associated flavoprotein CzcO